MNDLRLLPIVKVSSQLNIVRDCTFVAERTAVSYSVRWWWTNRILNEILNDFVSILIQWIDLQSFGIFHYIRNFVKKLVFFSEFRIMSNLRIATNIMKLPKLGDFFCALMFKVKLNILNKWRNSVPFHFVLFGKDFQALPCCSNISERSAQWTWRVQDSEVELNDLHCLIPLCKCQSSEAKEVAWEYRKIIIWTINVWIMSRVSS